MLLVSKKKIKDSRAFFRDNKMPILAFTHDAEANSFIPIITIVCFTD